jgi:hypothetical protein
MTSCNSQFSSNCNFPNYNNKLIDSYISIQPLFLDTSVIAYQLDTDAFRSPTGYSGTTGTLSSDFNETTGIFTSPTGGLFLVTLIGSFTNLNSEIPDDGNRQIYVFTPAFNTYEFGQSMWVKIPEGATGGIYSDLIVNNSAIGLVRLEQNESITVQLYQQNSRDSILSVDVYLSIIQISN